MNGLGRVFVLLLLVGLLARLPVRPALAQTATPPPGLALAAPLHGQALQGRVPVQVSLPPGLPGGQPFVSLEVAFAYAGRAASPGDWFLIYEANLGQEAGLFEQPLAQWDTGTISDGLYTLRVTLLSEDGTRQVLQAGDLRVRNYTPVETATPSPLPPASPTPPPARPVTRTPAAAGTQDAGADGAALTPSPTAAPVTPAAAPQRNPAELELPEVWLNGGRGALAVLGLFALGALYTLVRRLGGRDAS
ncbi:MAG: hypothetical protein ACKOC5_10085 [Chloroflexota bacterium]